MALSLTQFVEVVEVACQPDEMLLLGTLSSNKFTGGK